jgi:hypothetical protein
MATTAANVSGSVGVMSNNNALPVRQIHRRGRRPIEVYAADVADDADDVDGRQRPSTDMELLANRIFAGPQTIRRNGGHDGHASVAVGLGEEPTVAPRNTHRAEVVGAHGSNIAHDAIGDGRRALWPQGRVPALARERQLVRHAGCDDAGQSLRAFKLCSNECRPGGRCGVALNGQTHVDGQDAVGRESTIDLQEVPETMHQESAGNEAHGADGDFAGDKEGANPTRVPRGSHGHRAGLECVYRVQDSEAPGGQHADLGVVLVCWVVAHHLSWKRRHRTSGRTARCPWARIGNDWPLIIFASTVSEMVKWIERIEFVESEKQVGEGEGGKNEDDEYFDLLPNI